MLISDAPDDAVDLPPPETLSAAARAAQRDVARHTVRTVLLLTWPVVLGQLMANTVPVVDILMLGQLGTPTLAAVGYASQFLMLVQASLMAIGVACVAMMARAIGAQDMPRARASFAASLWLGIAASVLFAGVTLLFPRQLLHALAVSDSVVPLAVPYLRLTMASAPLMAIAFGCEHAFRAARDTFVPMLIAAFSALVKIAFNCLLLFGSFGLPKLGLIGAGIATWISQLCAVVLFVYVSRRHKSPAVRLTLADLRAPLQRMSEAFALAWPAVGERFVMNAAMLIYFRFLGGYGVEAVAAYNVGVRILAFTWIPGFGLAIATGTLVAHALGAGDAALARRSANVALRIGIGISLVLAAIFITFRLPIARWFTGDPAVVAALDPFILLLGVGLPFLVAHFTLSGALRGAGDTLTPLWAAVLGNWVFRVPLGYLSAEVIGVDLFWVWALMVVDHCSRALWLTIAFQRGKWQTQLGAGVGRQGDEEHVPNAA